MKRANCIAELAAKTRMRVAGLMSGTSADGVDVVIIDISADKVKALAFGTYPYCEELRKYVLQQTLTAADVCHLNFVLGEVFAESLIKLCKESKIPLASIDLVGSHGQTIYHNPRGRRFGHKTISSTLQIGEPAIIAHRTKITTVADFRPADMAARGQGAPLVPFADFFLFRDKRRNRAIQNIGGIANVTYLPANCRLRDIIAFDTGPGNMLIDGIISILSKGKYNCDKDGKLAAKGTIDNTILNKMLRHPFFKRRPPKSTGREEFGWKYCEAFYRMVSEKRLAPESIMATITAFTAVSIAQAYRRFLPEMPDEVILAGGGAHNRTLVTMLKQELGENRIILSNYYGINCDAREAISFAILAYATIKGIPNNVPSATGAKQPVVSGKIIPA